MSKALSLQKALKLVLLALCPYLSAAFISTPGPGRHPAYSGLKHHTSPASVPALVRAQQDIRKSNRRMVHASQDMEMTMPAPGSIKGILFDIDGTLCDSDPCHLAVFQDLLRKEGFNGGNTIDEEFFRKKIAGRQNAIICADFFPEWDTKRAEV
jgi:hypothetical protein